MAEDKKIKLSFAVDPKGLQDARNALKALTNDVKALIEQMGRAGTGLQSLMGGLSGKSGGIKASQESIKMPAVGGIGAGITKDAQALSQVSRAGTQAIDGLTRSLKANFSSQIGEIDRLRGKLAELERAYDKIDKIAETSMSPAVAGRAREHRVTKAGQMNEIEMEIQRREVAHGWEVKARRYAAAATAAGPQDAGGGGGVFGGGFGRFGGALTNAVGLGGMGSLLGLGGPAAAGIAAIALSKQMADTYATRHAANMANAVSIGMEPGRLGARIGSSLGGLGMSIRGGGLAASVAYDTMRGQLGSRNNLGSAREYLYQDQAGLTGSGVVTGSVSNMLAGAGQAADSVLFATRKNAADRDARDLAVQRARRAQTAEITEEQAEMIRNKIASSPLESYYYDNVYNNASAHRQLANVGGIGFGVVRRNGAPVGTRMSIFEENALNRGFEASELAGGRAQLGGIAGRGLMGHAGSMLSAQYGGFGAAAHVMGAGAQFNANPMALFNTAQLGMGRGGLDATAGSQIAAAVAQQMMGGNFAGAGGNDVMMGIMSAALTGTPGGDMRAARMAAAGLSEYGRNAAGATDGLQMGINTLAAGASGVKGFYARKMLMNMDPAQMIEALRGGKVPEYLKDAGVDIGNLERYNSFRNQYAFTRYLDKEGAGSRVGEAVSGVKSAGGLREYLHGKLRGVTKPSERRGIIQAELEKLGTARMLTEGGTREASIGALMAEVATDKSLAPDLRGGGAWRPSMKGTTEEEVYKNRAKNVAAEGKWEAERYEGIKLSISRMDQNQRELATITAGLVGDSKHFSEAVKNMTDAMMDAISIIAPAKAAEMRKIAKQQEEAMKKKAIQKSVDSVNEGHAGVDGAARKAISEGTRGPHRDVYVER